MNRVNTQKQQKTPIILREFVNGERSMVTKNGIVKPGTIIMETSVGSGEYAPFSTFDPTKDFGKRLAITKNDVDIDATGGVLIVKTRACTYNKETVVGLTEVAKSLLFMYSHFDEDYITGQSF